MKKLSLTKEQKEEYRKGFNNALFYGEEMYEVEEDGFFRCLSIEEMEKLKAETEGE